MDQSADSLDVRWVSDPQQLTALCHQWSDLGRIGIDTEFVRTRTFYAQLGLIQVADDADCTLVDPVSLSDLGPFWSLLVDTAVTKVLHSGSEDLEIFVRLGGHAPRPLFDTQVAAALCGMGPSLSYRALVAEFCGIDLAKGETRSDWLKRPLTDSQIRYAALDVRYLDTIYDRLLRRLQELDRLSWLTEDMERICRAAEDLETAPEQFRRFKLGWKLDSLGAQVLWQLVDWREETARRRDLPRNRVLEVDAMLDIAQHRPTTPQALSATRIDPRSARRHGKALLEIVDRAGQVPESERVKKPPAPLDLSTRNQMKRLKALVQDRADDLDLAPEVLCGKKGLVHLIRTGELPEKLTGWRRTVVGDALLEAL